MNKVLKTDGWKVIRFWEEEINTNLDQCIAVIKKHLEN
ncbi:MAG TPA: DUF559 domain-containing protein [Gammaproteobacteria bacterium]|nr:DUF559 domain-containing protein [Gammaproteobacteria bacterium]HIB25420.1 DUF559 domain-containing protein [Gammaproteobacteria bacterium]